MKRLSEMPLKSSVDYFFFDIEKAEKNMNANIFAAYWMAAQRSEVKQMIANF